MLYTKVHSTFENVVFRSIGIAFIGKYVDKMPSEAALEALKTFLKYLKKEGK